jgi:AmmeMemoRadiSam system protein A
MDPYVQLAQLAVKEYVINQRIIPVPPNTPAELLTRKAGVFVTLLKGKQLRGCIGTFLPTKENVSQEIITNAIAACSRDPRFMPIEFSEFPTLSYEVSLLQEPQPLTDFNQHDPQKHGLIVRAPDGRSGLLLPGLEDIDLTEKQLALACQKGGLDPHRDSLECFHFTTEKHV